MTKRASIRIIICLCSFALVILCGIALDQMLSPPNEARSQAYGSLDEAPLPQEELPSSTEALTTLLQEYDFDSEHLAQDYFDIPLGSEIPQAFEDECLPIDEFASAYSSGSIFGLIFEGDTNAAKQHCEQLLAKKGWRALANNNELISSFSRSQGTYRWLVLQYFAIDEKTMIIVNTIEPN